MNSDHAHQHHATDCRVPTFWRSRYGIGLILFGAIAAFFLLTEHRAHLFGALPFLLVLSCPLMHLFVHGGHGGHSGGTAGPDTSEIKSKEKT